MVLLRLEVLALCMQRQHHAGMPSITVRNVPPDVRDELAARAARAGRSLQEHLRAELIALARKPTVGDVLAAARSRTQATSSCLPAERILGHRDADRT
jgi:plasmid stability protein